MLGTRVGHCQGLSTVVTVVVGCHVCLLPAFLWLQLNSTCVPRTPLRSAILTQTQSRTQYQIVLYRGIESNLQLTDMGDRDRLAIDPRLSFRTVCWPLSLTDTFTWKVYSIIYHLSTHPYGCVEISIHFIKRRPASALKLILEEPQEEGVQAGVKKGTKIIGKYNDFHWNLYTSVHFATLSSSDWFIRYCRHVKIHTTAILTIQKVHLKKKVAEISVLFKPNKFRDDTVVRLKDVSE